MCEVKVQNHRSLGCTKAIFYEFYRIIKISKIREFLFTNFKTIGHEFSTCAHWPLWLKAYSHGKRPKQAGVSFTRRYDVVSRTARLKCLLSFCGRRRLPHTGQWWRLPQEKKLLIRRRPVRNWTRRTISSSFLCRKLHVFLRNINKNCCHQSCTF